jgi:alpha-galactosidase
MREVPSPPGSRPDPESIARLAVDRTTARVFEHGWQSWSPTTTYAVGDSPLRPRDARVHLMNARADSLGPRAAFRGEGLLAVQPAASAPVHVFGVRDARREAASIVAWLERDDLVVAADGPVEHTADSGPGGIDGALARWADGYAARQGVEMIRRPPTAWCTWYHYFTAVTATDVTENLAAIETLDLPVDVIQVDDGWQAGIGDWLAWSDAFRDLPGLVATVLGAGRRAGIWVAPFLVGARSVTASDHPEWLVSAGNGPVVAGRNWDQDLFALDTTHPGARAHLAASFGALRAMGIDYFKIDFLYAGAVPGERHALVEPLTAYRMGIEHIREAIGDAYLLGCGAPVLPSVGLFDAMRISPDTAPHWEPETGDLSEPGARSAVVTGRARAFQHGRFWVNDPDCLLVRPAVERRELWADHVARYGGLRVSSDRVRDLDAWGLETTRELLSTAAPARFVSST